MQFLLPLFYILVFIFLILKMDFFSVSAISRGKLVMLFLLKLFAAVLVWIIYTQYYSGSDFFTYFSDSERAIGHIFNHSGAKLSTAWTGNFDDSITAGAKPMIVLNVILFAFSFGNFYVHAVFFCFFSFLGLTALLKSILRHFSDKKIILIPLFFIPGILFWGSAPLKESVIIGSLGLIVYLTDFGIGRKISSFQISALIILFLLLVFLRFYVLLALLPVMLVNAIPSSRLFLKYLIVAVCSIVFFILAASIDPDYNILKIISDKQAKAISEAQGGVFLQSNTNFICVPFDQQEIIQMQADSSFVIKNGSSYLSWPLENMSDTTLVRDSRDTSRYKKLYAVSPAGSVIKMSRLSPEPLSFLYNVPKAFCNVLFHPSVFEINSWLQLAAAIENLWLLVFVFLPIFFFDRSVMAKKEIIIFCLVFSVILFVLIGLTTPAIGAMLRYRSIPLLFLTTACVLMTDVKKLQKLFSRKN